MHLPSLGLVALAASAAASPVPVEETSTLEQRGFGNFRNDILAATNWYRHQHGAKPLKWNDKAAASAANWAKQCKWQHQSGNSYGENLAAGGFSSWFDIVNMWGHERVDYDWNKPGFSLATGHFTQLVWKKTSSVGCAWHDCGKGNGGGATGRFVVCEYASPGNYQGQFTANVGKQTIGKPGDKYHG
ncbi:hypothetical protein Golomagni_06658 [Golovinomyces magnicellulatus]|nr:hypothetical protein Golomagni_06658 [Golovinomyces magnicellulatus]